MGKFFLSAAAENQKNGKSDIQAKVKWPVRYFVIAALWAFPTKKRPSVDVGYSVEHPEELKEGDWEGGGQWMKEPWPKLETSIK